MKVSHSRLAAAVAASVLAVTSVTASGYPADGDHQPAPGAATHRSETAGTVAGIVDPRGPDGFDWQDAGVGFAAAGGIVLLLGGGVGALRRQQRRGSGSVASL